MAQRPSLSKAKRHFAPATPVRAESLRVRRPRGQCAEGWRMQPPLGPGWAGRALPRTASGTASLRSRRPTSSTTTAACAAGLARCKHATSAPGLGSPTPHRHRDWAHPRHIGTGTGLNHATSAPGLGSPALALVSKQPADVSAAPDRRRGEPSPLSRACANKTRPLWITAKILMVCMRASVAAALKREREGDPRRSKQGKGPARGLAFRQRRARHGVDRG